jgi:CheY-like chemotaxis protein
LTGTWDSYKREGKVLPANNKVLIVEDNEMNLELVTDLLEANGYEVVKAKDGAEALRLAEEDAPSLVLMDIQLPGMDGLEVTRQMKASEKTSNIKVIALTAHAMVGDEERAREAGCSGYIAKPIDTRNFISSISGYMEE